MTVQYQDHIDNNGFNGFLTNVYDRVWTGIHFYVRVV